MKIFLQLIPHLEYATIGNNQLIRKENIDSNKIIETNNIMIDEYSFSLLKNIFNKGDILSDINNYITITDKVI